MKLRTLKLHGFKSFADRTELTFHDGITAVVGPNGCGKSNISDAIRWVLGEQRASAIRGSRMEEAIFQGTAERRPVNRAEVSLTFSNTGGRLELPYEEIEVRRTIFREGGSEYELNRTPCRLRDILDLCRDTGLGATAYAVIEQRMVDGILSDRTDDRRQIFEEAAGVGRYKDRRRAAERRLEAAHADLERLEDLIGEVKSKVRSLSRQRRQAERYRELRKRRLDLEVTLAELELQNASREHQEISNRLETIAEEEPTRRAAIAQLEIELEERRIEAAEVSHERSELAGRLEGVGQQIARRDRELIIVGERHGYSERRLTQIENERRELLERAELLVSEIASLRESQSEEEEYLDELSARLEEVSSRQQNLRHELVTARGGEEELRRREDQFGRKIAELDAAITRGESEIADTRDRLDRLRVEEEEFQAELERERRRQRETNALIEELEVTLEGRKVEYEGARDELEGLRLQLSEARQAKVTLEAEIEQVRSRLKALEALERGQHGLAPQTAAVLRAGNDHLEGVIGALAELLEIPPEKAASVEDTLGSLLQLLVVEDRQALRSVQKWIESTEEGGEGGTLGIIEPELVPEIERLIDAIEIVGEPSAEAVLLGRRTRIEELAARAHELEEELEKRVALHSEIELRMTAAEERARELERAYQQVEMELARSHSLASEIGRQLERLERGLDGLRQRETELEGTIARTLDEVARAEEARAELIEEVSGSREAVEDARRALIELERAWESAREEEYEVGLLHARAEADRREVERREQEAERQVRQIQEQVAALDQEAREHGENLKSLAAARLEAEEALEELFGIRDSLSEGLREFDERLTAISQITNELEDTLRSRRRGAEALIEERHRLELRRGELGSTIRGIRERLEVEWGRPYSQLVESAKIVEGEPEPLRAELHAVAADLERLGPINMLAIEEYEEENARLTFITEQRDDLIRARDDLQDAIRQINRHARELFTKTFNEVRANFHRTFGTLFEGGTCDLTLTDPDDPLESDIEISASPRGKRTQRIHLLSGGERALTALSLLFAIYLVKPSPFCVLDEVDAPLDESNVGRFVTMLQEFKKETQFIVITHNPRTIEAADWVYGVTMEEPGVSTMVGVQLDEALAAAGNSNH